ncbi:hypothetical protein [Herpetosiphon sp. NSE202]|uniref:hypothetical protein n=1 Tax=Herpetosiphon sp. NSE202 TaxID=3351349 RepID=UPI00362B4192
MMPWHKLTDGLDATQQRELGDLQGVAEQLASAAGPTPSAADRARLLANLRPLVAARAQHAAIWPTPTPPSIRSWLRLIMAQTSLMEPLFWWLNVALWGLGLLVGMISGADTLITVLVVGSPVLTATGIVYLFRPATRSLRELETTYPTSPLELLYARLCLMMGLNGIIAVGFLSIIWLQTPSLILWRLVIAWLGPMLGIAGLALVTSVRWGTLVGSAAPVVVWIGLVLLGWRSLDNGLVQAQTSLLGESVRVAINQSNTVLWGGIFGLGVGIGLLIYAGRLVGKEQRWNFGSAI